LDRKASWFKCERKHRGLTPARVSRRVPPRGARTVV